MAEYHGHVTMADGSHVALTEAEAKALWDKVDADKAARTVALPTARDALRSLIDAEERLRELGWARGGGLRVRRGDECAVSEPGSTGIWRGRVDEEGKYVHFGDCVAAPQKCFLKPVADLTDEERAWMEECDHREAESYSAMIHRMGDQSNG